jgi:hypothetical protein
MEAVNTLIQVCSGIFVLVAVSEDYLSDIIDLAG